MREIISLQVGLCGNRLGAKFWETICEEHGVDGAGAFRGDNAAARLEKINVFYAAAGETYVPRAICVDLKQDSMAHVRWSPYGNLFRPDQFVIDHLESSQNWAKGHYTDGAERVEYVLNAVRQEAERCDSLQAFHFIHSLGGGTGSGMGTLLLSKIRDQYPDKRMATFSVFPSQNVHTPTYNSYHATLGVSELIEHADLTFCIDNEALHRICRDELALPSPSYDDFNHFGSMAMSGATTCLRFPHLSNADLCKPTLNIVPFPRLHFLTTNVVPLALGCRQANYALTVRDLANQLFWKANEIVDCDITRGRYLSAAAIFRGRMSMQEVLEQVTCVQNRFRIYDWLPDAIQTSICAIPSRGLAMSAAVVGNTTAIHETFDRVYEQVKPMIKRRLGIHRYTAEGMEEMEFIQALCNLHSLSLEYEVKKLRP